MEPSSDASDSRALNSWLSQYASLNFDNIDSVLGFSTLFMDLPSIHNHYLAQHTALLRNSFRQLLGRDLLDADLENSEFAKRLFLAPFAVLSHNTDPDPVFNYANSKALELFELDWEALTKLPSRYSAETINQQARSQLLKKVSRDGYIEDYQGIRISKTGKRFQIKHAIVWNLYDNEQRYCGQAAYFNDWQFL